MTKNQIATAAVATTIGAVFVIGFIQVRGSEAELVKRFPDLDPKLVVKAHRKMLRMAMRQDPAIVAAEMMDDNFDRILRDIVASLKK
jgi:hypothetical protein